MARPRLLGRGREEARLDPIRWRRPGRGVLIRLVSIAALLATAALITWSAPETCAPAPTPAGGPSNARGSAASADSAAQQGQEATARGQEQLGIVDSGGGADGKQAADGNGRAAVPAGTVGVPVRLAEPAALALIHPGDRVDLLRIGGDNRDPSTVAAAALVLSVTGADDPTAGGLLVALTPAEAARAVAEPGGGFAVLIRP